MLRALVGLALGSVASLKAWVPLPLEPWADGVVPVVFDLERTAPPGVRIDWHGAAADAMNRWNVLMERVQLQRAPTEVAAWYENGRNELFFDRQEYDEPWPAGVLAVTYVHLDRGRRIETDVVFNPNWEWSLYQGPPSGRAVDFRRVVAHELGHVLGLDHPDTARQTVSALMNSRFGTAEAPTADDEAGMRALYDHEVRVPPVVLRSPQGVSTVEGAVITLRVTAGGRGPLQYQWTRNGAPLAGATGETLAFSAQTADSGTYVARVANAAGAVASESAQVTVRAALAPVFSNSEGSSRQVFSGETITHERALSRGDQPIRWQWRKDGVALQGQTAATLSLEDVQFSDRGDYTLVATNSVGSAISLPWRLSVGPPPPLHFSSTLAHVAIPPGQPHTLTAPLPYHSGYSYQWLRNGVELPGASWSSLDIPEITEATAGAYSLRISSSFGSYTGTVATISAFGRAPVNFLRQPVAQRVVAGGAATFEVETDAAAPRYQWLRDGQAINGATDRTFTVSAATYRDRAAYAVDVTIGGERRRSGSARLEVMPASRLVFRLHPATHTVTAGFAVQLAGTAVLRPDPASPAGDAPPIMYQWFKDGVALPGKTGDTVAFVASAATAGRYVLRATAGGLTEDSEEAEVELVPRVRFFSIHPASELVPELTGPQLEARRLEALADEGPLRRMGVTVHYYSRNGVRMEGSPYLQTNNLEGVYTRTMSGGGITEVSRPFSLGFLTQVRPEIIRHPVGGVARSGGSFRLSVEAKEEPGLRYTWYLNGSWLTSSEGKSEYVIGAMTSQWAGDYTVRVFNRAGWTESAVAAVGLADVEPPLILKHPLGRNVESNQQFGLGVEVAREVGAVQWLRNGQVIPGATTAVLTLTGSAAVAGGYAARVASETRQETSRVAQVTFGPGVVAPQVISAPAPRTVPAGGDVDLAFGVAGEPQPDRYQWRKDGREIPGATDARLKLRGVAVDSAGSYSVTITSSAGTVTSVAIPVAVDSGTRLVNLATRAVVGRGAEVLIAGFVISGTRPREVLLRGIGDQLSDFGVEGVLRDPTISVFDAQGKRLAQNDDWTGSGAIAVTALKKAAERSGAFPLRSDSRDGALVMTLQPGSYTAQVAGLANTTGVALVEIYEVGVPASERLINLSSRAMVGRGANILIPGMVIGGATPRRLLIRAVGPGLADLGVAGALSDPVMSVYRGAARIAGNDDWERQPGAAEVTAATIAVGAFPLKPGSRDAALVQQLPPGSYTVQVAGAEDSTGIALVEVYEIAP